MNTSRFLTSTAIATLLGVTACSLDDVGRPNQALLLGSAFGSAPAGMDLTSSSYVSDGAGLPWGGPMRGPGGFLMGGVRGGPGGSAMMGGGIGADFTGAGEGGRGAHRGPFAVRIDASCTVAGGDVTWGPTARGGLSVTTVYTITSLAGAPQTAIDTLTTNTVRTRTTVTGRVTRSRDGSVTATVINASDRTVSGLAQSSTSRTVNGISRGTETATGTNRDGQTFTATRTANDVTSNLIVPVSTTRDTYPVAGTVTRDMSVVTQVAGGAATTNIRREVLTLDGTATARLVITQHGTPKRCTVALPRGRPACE